MFSEIQPPKVGVASTSVGGASDDVKWEYKWTNEDEKIHGPFTSTEMAEWQEQG